MLGDLDLNDKKIVGLGTPETLSDAANKYYVDQMNNNLWDVFKKIGARNLRGNEIGGTINSLTRSSGDILYEKSNGEMEIK